MHYRVSNRIHGISLDPKTPLEILVDGGRVLVRLQNVVEGVERYVLGSAAVEENWPEEIEKLLEEAAQGRPLEPPERNSKLLEFHKEVGTPLRKHLEEVVLVVRWRGGFSEGPVDAFSHPGDEYSHDGIQWTVMPRYVASFRIEFGGIRASLTPSVLSEGVTGLLSSGKEEPLGHQLLREAFEQRKTHPRSSLVIGIAAIEVGFKQFIADLVPDAEWLVVEAPSPPLDQMLQKYLPQLPARGKFDGEYALVPSKMIKVISDGVVVRNKLVHSGKFPFDAKKLEILLRTINDLLWMLDGYSGERWALDHVSADSQQLLAEAISKRRESIPAQKKRP